MGTGRKLATRRVDDRAHRFDSGDAREAAGIGDTGSEVELGTVQPERFHPDEYPTRHGHWYRNLSYLQDVRATGSVDHDSAHELAHDAAPFIMAARSHNSSAVMDFAWAGGKARDRTPAGTS